MVRPGCSIGYEKVTGVTDYYIAKELDGGDMLLQRPMVISQVENKGQPKWKLANLAGEMIHDLLGMFAGLRMPARLRTTGWLPALPGQRSRIDTSI
jgi:methionyl-tRNA formyltransferase